MKTFSDVDRNRKRGYWSIGTLLLLCAAWCGVAAPAAPSLEQCVAVLKSAAPQKEKVDACRELARIGTKEAVAPLAALLADENLSHMARYGLETIRDPAVDHAFRDALGQLHGRPLVGVIGSIGVRRDAKAVRPLAKLLASSDPDVAQAAARALGSIGNRAAANALLSALPAVSSQSQAAFCEGLFRCAENLARQGSAAKAVAIYDEVRARSLPHQVRTAALRGAILTRGPAGVKLLEQTLAAEDFALFAAATRIAREMPGAGVTAVLAAQLPKVSVDKQLLLIASLSKRGDPSALPALCSAARNCEKPVRLAAIRALPGFAQASTVPVLTELMAQQDQEVGQAAQESLAGTDRPEVDAAVMSLMASDDPQRRITGMELAARRRMAFAVPVLLHAARDPQPQIRTVALRKLGELAGPSEIPAILDLLANAQESTDLDPAEQALGAVCTRATDPEAVAGEVGQRFAAASVSQRAALVRVLAAVGGNHALDCLRKSTKDSSPEVRATAIRALGGWNTADAAPDLLALARANSDATERVLSLRSYLNLASQADLPSDKRLALCREVTSLVGTDDEKKLLLAALGHLQLPESLALIQPYLDDSAVKDEAAVGTLAIAAKLLEDKDAANVAPQLIPPLEKIAAATSNADLARRARSLLDQARKKNP